MPASPASAMHSSCDMGEPTCILPAPWLKPVVPNSTLIMWRMCVMTGLRCWWKQW